MDTTIDRLIRDWYGLHLHTDDPGWASIPHSAVAAAGHAAGFIVALDYTDPDLAVQLGAGSGTTIGQSALHLSRARNAAWRAVNALVTLAYGAGCTSAATQSHDGRTPGLVQSPDISRTLYPALVDRGEPATPPRFTARIAERIRHDLDLQVTAARAPGIAPPGGVGDGRAHTRPSADLQPLAAGRIPWKIAG